MKPGSPEWLRVFGSYDRVEWVTAQPSVASGRGPCVNAHTKNGGAGRKADYIWIVPLTNFEHTAELHQHGQRTFERKYSIDLIQCAVDTEARWQTHLRETGVVPW